VLDLKGPNLRLSIVEEKPTLIPRKMARGRTVKKEQNNKAKLWQKAQIRWRQITE
jgi:hypothetical protein